MSRPKVPDVSGREYAYLGHFRKERFLREGHNFDYFDFARTENAIQASQEPEGPSAAMTQEHAQAAVDANAENQKIRGGSGMVTKDDEAPDWRNSTPYFRMGGRR